MVFLCICMNIVYEYHFDRQYLTSINVHAAMFNMHQQSSRAIGNLCVFPLLFAYQHTSEIRKPFSFLASLRIHFWYFLLLCSFSLFLSVNLHQSSFFIHKLSKSEWYTMHIYHLIEIILWSTTVNMQGVRDFRMQIFATQSRFLGQNLKIAQNLNTFSSPQIHPDRIIKHNWMNFSALER